MAVEQKVRTQLQLVFENGVNQDGKMMFKRKSFNNVKTDATADQLMAVSDAIIPLQEKTLHAVERNDSSVVLSE